MTRREKRLWIKCLFVALIGLATGFAAQHLRAQEANPEEHQVDKPASAGTTIDCEQTGSEPPRGIRALFVIAGLAAWYTTQYLIGRKCKVAGDQLTQASPLLSQHDRLFKLTAPVNQFLNAHPRWANGLLIASSAVIDLLGLFLLLWSIFGPSIRPFLGLVILYGLRQICQALTALPPPKGMIWRSPGFPSLLVTYGVANDFFFSGHTALAAYGAAELGRLGQGWLVAVAVAIVVFEIATVLVLRAHYTLDVFTALVTALFVALLVGFLAPPCDQFLIQSFAK